MKNEEKKIHVRQLTVYEQKKLEQKRKQNKENLIKDQIVQGKKYKGKGFEVSERLEFLDFEVGKVYEKNINLVNISWSFNSFKILPISKVFLNNFEIEYSPPGRVSAGISTPLKLVFFPQSRINIDTVLPLLCETGNIEIPIKCRFKTTDVRLEKNQIDFGTTIIGDEKIKEIYIENFGGLETKFEIQDYKGQKISKSTITISVISSQSDGNDDNSSQEEYENKQYQVDYDFFHQNMTIEYKKTLKGYSKNKIVLTYKPTNVSEFKTILIFKFNNFMDQKDLQLEIFGKSQNPKITCKKSKYNLKNCLIGQIYRQKIVFINQSKQTSNIKIIQPSETKEFFQFNPQLSFIQPRSQANVWLKVILKEKIREYLEEYITDDELILPLKAQCSEQKKLIEFKIILKLSSQEVLCQKLCNFGNIYENTSNVQVITFINKSLMPCKLLYQNLPQYIQILNLPNPFDISPNSQIDIKLQYKAIKIGRDSGSQMTGEIIQNFNATVKKMPIKISALKLEFPVCQPEEIHNHFILIQNISRQNYMVEFQPPPFEFSGIQIDVKFQKILSQKTKKFPISFEAKFIDKNLSEDMIQSLMDDDNIKIDQQKLKELQQKNIEIQEEKLINKGKKDILKQLDIDEQQNQELIEQKKESIQRQIENFKQNFNFDQEIKKLGGQMKNIKIDNQDVQFKRWLIPIQFKEENQPDTQIKIVYLEIETLIRKPVLQLLQKKIDFGILPLGFKKILNFEIENKTDIPQDLKMDLLEYNSGFNVLNILQTLGPYQKQQYSIRFQPEEAKMYNENLRIFDKFATNLQLVGQAIYPEILLKDDIDFLDMDSIYYNKSITKSFTIINEQQYDMLFTIKSNEIGQSCQGVQDIFHISPIQQIVPKNSSVDIAIKFQPQNTGIHFFVKLLLEVKEMQQKKYFYIRGKAFKNYGYVVPYNNDIKQYIEDQIQQKVDKKIQSKDYNNNFINLNFELKEDQQEQIQQLLIGNIVNEETNNSLEYEIVIEQSNYQKYFSTNVTKGKLNSGEKQILDIKYSNTNQNNDQFIHIQEVKRIENQIIKIIFKGDIDNEGNKIDQRIFLLNINFIIFDIINQFLVFYVTCIQ